MSLSVMPLILGFSAPVSRQQQHHASQKGPGKDELWDKPQGSGLAGEPACLLVLLLCPGELLRVNHYQLWHGLCQAITVALMGRHVTYPPTSKCFLGKPWRQREAEPAALVTLLFYAIELPLDSNWIFLLGGTSCHGAEHSSGSPLIMQTLLQRCPTQLLTKMTSYSSNCLELLLANYHVCH